MINRLKPPIREMSCRTLSTPTLVQICGGVPLWAGDRSRFALSQLFLFTRSPAHSGLRVLRRAPEPWVLFSGHEFSLKHVRNCRIPLRSLRRVGTRSGGEVLSSRNFSKEPVRWSFTNFAFFATTRTPRLDREVLRDVKSRTGVVKKATHWLSKSISI